MGVKFKKLKAKLANFEGVANSKTPMVPSASVMPPARPEKKIEQIDASMFDIADPNRVKMTEFVGSGKAQKFKKMKRIFGR